jgi:CRISPR-associated endonuclease Csn1
LDEKLELFEFGRALFHINQRRGFKSNRKSGKAKEDKGVLKEAGELQKEIENKGFRTLGEYFASLNPEEQRIRDWYTFRAMYEKEFDLLWAKQAEYYPQVLTEDLQKRIRDEIIFFQRPMRWNPETIGNCELEPAEKRCPRGDWYARKFRILQDVNNLIIQNPDGAETKLTGEHRKIVLDALCKKERLKFNDIRKKLGLMETQKFNAEYKIGKNGKKVESLSGDVFAAEMRGKNLFGPQKWDEMDEQEKIRLNDAVLELEDDELREKMMSEYGFDEEQADKWCWRFRFLRNI